jgi:SAM-dependent methyltransferase
MELEPYERFYYSYQTRGRGLESAEDLTRAFEEMAHSNDEIFGPLLPKTGIALDIACGFGNMLFYFEKRGLTASGFDLDQNQIDLARSLGLNARYGDLSTEIRNVTGPVNVISAMDVIEHLRKNDAVELLRQIYEVLPSGGILLLRCPCADGFTGAHDIFNDMTHRWGATSIVVRQILMAIGFERVELLDISLPRFPTTIRSKVRARCIKIARRLAGPLLRLLGVNAPRIWSASVVAVAWK